jgi:hypothetical protein
MDDLLLNLRILSKVPIGGRLNSSGDTMSISSSRISSLYRRFVGENRTGNIKSIEIIIDSVLYTVKEIFNSKFYDEENYKLEYLKRKDKILKYYQAMGRAIDGIKNLKDTYQNDIPTVSRLDIIVDRVEYFLNEYKDI